MVTGALLVAFPLCWDGVAGVCLWPEESSPPRRAARWILVLPVADFGLVFLCSERSAVADGPW